MRTRVALMLPFVLGIGSCTEAPVAPHTPALQEDALFQQGGRPQRGTGLALESFTTGLPIVGDFQITQVVITEFTAVVGGLQASGTVTGASISVPGLTVTEDFTADVLVSSSPSGRCEVVGIDLGPFSSELLAPLVEVNIPEANVEVAGTGPVGPVLCALTRLVNSVGGGAVRALVGVLNALI
jgi:hypothetical protein